MGIDNIQVLILFSDIFFSPSRHIVNECTAIRIIIQSLVTQSDTPWVWSYDPCRSSIIIVNMEVRLRFDDERILGVVSAITWELSSIGFQGIYIRVLILRRQ